MINSLFVFLFFLQAILNNKMEEIVPSIDKKKIVHTPQIWNDHLSNIFIDKCNLY